MWNGQTVVDTDGHIMEPLWDWGQYLDPAFRGERLRVLRDASDGDKLLIEGRPSALIRRLGGIPAPTDGEIRDWNTLPRQGEFASYRESCTFASWDGAARLAWLDAAGIDATLLFPSLGLIWPRETDPTSPWAVAHFDAYNRWITEMASVDRTRLHPVAQLPLTDDAAQRLRHLAAAGFAHAMIPGGFGADLSRGEAVFTAAEGCEVTLHLHKVAIPHFLPITASSTSLRAREMNALYNHINETLPGQLHLAALISSGVLDRYPRLRFAFHECNAGWLPAWLDRADDSWETLRGNHVPQLPALPPREYLTDRDSLFFSVGLGEDLTSMPDWLMSRLTLATDYPHPGTPKDPAAAWVEVLPSLSAAAASGLLGANAARMSPSLGIRKENSRALAK
ncbi:amidohydrolase family protein [Kitasatospora sp. NPDC058115]|uniref:amidohydrolase family protein n=1 Tax=Kitasatospora sp. NPDC058115 TaxID=3346347 RepID=UPI0036DDD16C